MPLCGELVLSRFGSVSAPRHWRRVYDAPVVRVWFYLETSFMFSYSFEAAKAEEVPFHSAIAPGL